MAVTDYKIESFRETVAGMPDNPTMEGWPADRVKKTFDSSAEELRVSLNGLIDYISERDEDIENKVDKQEGMGLSKNNFTDRDKVLVDTIGFKADKDNVIEKDSTVIFMPTEDAQPASKRYVDEKVNEKITELGGGDMTQAVYDPWGRKTDIFAYMDNYLCSDVYDPKGKETDIFQYVDDAVEGVTAADVEALPLTGGKLTGKLEIENSGPEFYMRNTSTGRYYHILVGGDKNIYFRNSLDANNRTAFYLQPETGEKLERLFRLQKVVNGTSILYNVYGEHNKPSGSYTGNGSSAERKISVDGAGDVLLVRSLRDCYFVTPDGFKYSLDSAVGTNFTTTFKDGVLTLSGNSCLNESGTAYYYTVL